MTNANGGMTINSSGANLYLDSRTLNNAAGQTATWTGDANFGGDIRFQNGAIFNNNGTFLAQSDQYLYDFSGTGAFNNAGTFTRNNNPGTLTLYNLAFNNTGTVNVQTGTLDLQSANVTQYAGYALTAGVWSISAGANLNSLRPAVAWSRIKRT